MTTNIARRTHDDRKVTRLRASWLAPTRADARWLAAVADIAVTEPGSALDTTRHSYLPLDDAHRGTVITESSPSRTLACPTTVMVVANRDLGELARRIDSVGHALTTGPAAEPVAA